MIIKVGGRSYFIENWDEFRDKFLEAVGVQVESAIIQEVNRLRIVDTGDFKTSIRSEVVNGELIISSDAPHAPYLEYGTVGTKKGVTDPFGDRSRGPDPGRKLPIQKKGDRWELVPSLKSWAKRHGLSEENSMALAKYIQEHGMEPKAPFRTVLRNPEKMADIISKAAKVAS